MPVPPQEPWIRRTERTDHDYKHLYDALIAELNAASMFQAYATGIGMTNTHHGTATLSWFFRPWIDHTPTFPEPNPIPGPF